ncbi:GMC family oxidoreductase [Haloarcula nitratireducens]|uniref:GMC family oxidoreductase n=1 Tax=Haloarcula nitratireducens TaxID=2487749 RepID=A0AAW4PFQ0_9EURY|nr:GMC family oxidoreductase [Halomicroarcula nitratireducens]MBX0296734.1 GMC family oxidoreductase [Halomicroarcula nitratireducens]
MPTRLDPVEVVTIGAGWAGSIIAKELTEEGIEVVSLERGGDRGPDSYMKMHDELRYDLHFEFMQDLSRNTYTFRHSRDQKALPMRKYGSFLPGTGVGGAGVHWNGQTWRYLPYDFQIRSRTIEAYGEEKIPDWMPLQDWGITYEELRPYYWEFEEMTGISGKAGNLLPEAEGRPNYEFDKHEGNPFEGPRAHEFPTPPMIQTPSIERFMDAADSLGLHPFMAPSANLSEEYTNDDGVSRDPCQYCGFCDRFGCEWGAKASPIVTSIPVAKETGNYEIRTHKEVLEILYDEANQEVDGVRYIDRQTGDIYDQPAEAVALTAFALNNVHLLLYSGIGEPYDPETGEGVVGKNYCYQNNCGTPTGFFDDEKWNLYMGAGALSGAFDDFNGNNFDHSDLDFIHGGNTAIEQVGIRPVNHNPVPPGTDSWGSEFKKQSLKYNYSTLFFNTQGAQLPSVNNYLDLDPEYTDEYGRPLLRITFDWTPNDRNMAEFMAEKNNEVMRAMNPDKMRPASGELGGYNIYEYQSTHNAGGAIMGDNPDESVVNTYLQHWDAENLFVPGASAFPHQAGYNPTDTVGALSFRAAEGMLEYLEGGGMLE